MDGLDGSLKMTGIGFSVTIMENSFFLKAQNMEFHVLTDCGMDSHLYVLQKIDKWIPSSLPILY